MRSPDKLCVVKIIWKARALSKKVPFHFISRINIIVGYLKCLEEIIIRRKWIWENWGEEFIGLCFPSCFTWNSLSYNLGVAHIIHGKLFRLSLSMVEYQERRNSSIWIKTSNNNSNSNQIKCVLDLFRPSTRLQVPLRHTHVCKRLNSSGAIIIKRTKMVESIKDQ